MANETVELDRFLETMSLAALQAGAVALQFRGKVATVGKTVDAATYKDALHRSAAEALSDVDLAAQEIILHALAAHFPFVSVEPEEETPTVARFAANVSPYTVVLDPIDGTLNYLTTTNQFAVAVGLLEEARFVASVVYFPLLGELHRANRGGGAEILRTDRASARDRVERLVFRDTTAPETAIAALMRAGFAVERSGCSMVDSTVVATKLGEASVCSRRPSIRRAIGALLSAEAGGYLCDLGGRAYDCTRPDGLDSLVIAPSPARAEQILAAFDTTPPADPTSEPAGR
jgi:fructose-1,6-bisphosphatase/inositol monophosphatase family enzyme